jgi:hypothetical protein
MYDVIVTVSTELPCRYVRIAKSQRVYCKERKKERKRKNIRSKIYKVL